MMRWIGETIAKQKRSPAFGGAVRSYVIGRGVVDHRTNVQRDVEETLDGDLDPFMRESLVQHAARS